MRYFQKIDIGLKWFKPGLKIKLLVITICDYFVISIKMIMVTFMITLIMIVYDYFDSDHVDCDYVNYD